MNQDFFKEIAKCPPHHQEQEDIASTEKIYQAVKKKIDKRKKIKKYIFNFIVGISATAAALGLSFLSWDAWLSPGGQNEKTDRLILYVFAAKGAGGDPLAAEESELEKKEVTEEEVILGEYSAILSNSVGLPIMFMDSENLEGEGKVSVKVTEGDLVLWDRYIGTVDHLGQEGTFDCGEEIYWSPPFETDKIEQAVMEASLYIDGEKKDTIKAKLRYEEPTFTLVKIKKGGD